MLLPGGITRSFSYDNRMRIQAITAKKPDASPIQAYGYTYDGTNNITQKATEHGHYDDNYDQRQRLTQATDPQTPATPEGWTYDPNGNRTSDNRKPGPWTYDDNGRLLQSPLADYQYDNYGNLIEETKTGGQTLHYTYNAENRLAEIQDLTDPQTPTLIARYVYDPMGRRIAKTLPDAQNPGQTTTRYFHYTQEGLSGEYDPTGQAIQRYGYRPDGTWTTDPVYTITEQGTAFYHTDHLGTPQQLTDLANEIVWQGRATAFGETSETIVNFAQPLRFAGQYEDQETGRYYNYARYYDPQVGRYITSDPIGLEGGINTYSYVVNNPITRYDPDGLKTCGTGWNEPIVPDNPLGFPFSGCWGVPTQKWTPVG
ncbi:MAG: RHS domain-containing protein [Chromatiales bacterium]|nr:RHS domain-containing protein [Chromatiales bacterium]